MLKCHLAADKICLASDILFRIKIFDKFNIESVKRLSAPHIGWIETNPLVAAQVTYHSKKITFPAADFYNCFVPQVVLGNQVFGETMMKLIESRRKRLAF